MTTQPTQEAPKAKISPLFLGLAFITICLSSWGLYRLFHDFAHMPWWLAVCVVGGLDLAAVAFGKHALTVSADGDSPAPWNALLLLFTGLAAYVQFVHAELAGDPQIIGVTMAAFPVATVLLFEGQLRRAARLNGRAAGRVAPPRRTVPLLVWLRFPVQSWRAFSDAIRALGHLEDSRPGKAKPRQSRRTAGSNTPILHEAAGAAPTVAPVRNEPDRPQTVAAAVRAAWDELGDNPEAIQAKVGTTHPGVPEETVRRNLNRIRKTLTNGHVHA